MSSLLWKLIEKTTLKAPDTAALRFKDAELSYADLWGLVDAVAEGLLGLGLGPLDRVAVYLPKQVETVATLFGASRAGGAFVPINPALKSAQVAYIMTDCDVRVLVTSRSRFEVLKPELAACLELCVIILVDDDLIDDDRNDIHTGGVKVMGWDALTSGGDGSQPHPTTPSDLAAILYTSGSTGKPKGVMLSHANMVVGAKSVAGYLDNRPEDRLLAVLPLSFDYGFSQLSTAFHVGASVTLMNYLFPRDILKKVAAEGITGLACVPPLWFQLAELNWPDEARASLRYITSTGGRMPHALVEKLQGHLPESDIYLMYGLTEAFRSTYLPPDQIEARPNSIGKAIPNAEILVARPDGTVCDADEPGELVHKGPLVGMGYWNDPERTAERYKIAPGEDPASTNPEIAVWSGDKVKKDADGYIYFIGRDDDMIKTSGFRVSPTEVEEAVYASGTVAEVAAIGIEDPTLGQKVAVVVTAREGETSIDQDRLLAHCRQALPSYMVPTSIVELDALPRNANGKVDRKALKISLDGASAEASR